ncbi:NUDIX domain-containing protein [Photobacterium makurazakiensis]|uniref:NUDIX hydrolase n=1 Tax=Photobacterium makurazakiensis TaxID=2910234 RepID=UPI003D0FFC25
MGKVIDKLAWLHIHDGKLLVVRSKGKELFYIPGGKREVGESDEQALVREVKEELSVDLEPKTIKYAGSFTAQADGKASDVSVQLTCYYSDFNGDLKPDAEIDELNYFDMGDVSSCSLATILVIEQLTSQGLIGAKHDRDR